MSAQKPTIHWSPAAMSRRYAASLSEAINNEQRFEDDYQQDDSGLTWKDLAIRVAEPVREKGSTSEVNAQKTFAPYVIRHLVHFLRRECPQELLDGYEADVELLSDVARDAKPGLELGSVPQNRIYCHEGDQQKGGSLHRSYWLMGTQAHTDAAVIRPFRVAIEYDLQPASGTYSWFKQRTAKTAMHVISGAYDAAVQIAVPHVLDQGHEMYLTGAIADRDTKNARGLPADPYTEIAVERLRGLGVYFAVLSGAR